MVQSVGDTRASLLRQAKAGDPDAAIGLAQLLWRRKERRTEAIEWFRFAVAKGSARHKRVLGTILCWEEGQHRDFTEGFALLEAAAAAGDATAQYLVAAELATGEHRPRDARRAAKWYRCAAKKGSAEASYNLAMMYLEGDGVRRNSAMAVKLLRHAAKRGELFSLRALAEGYEHGINGLRRNTAHAQIWRLRYEARKRAGSRQVSKA